MNRNYKCRECSKSFKSAAELRRHQLVHTNIRIYKCKHCDKSFKLRWHLRNHQLLHDSDTSNQTPSGLASKAIFGCSRCEKLYMKLPDLVRHIGRVHLHQKHMPAIRPHCEHCNSDFPSFDRLRRHRIAHGLERPHNCDLCHKSFTTTTTLSIHLAAHATSTGTTKTCGLCQLTFVSFRDLSAHMRSSHGTKVPLNCPRCGKIFRRNWDLTQHLHTHAAVRPFRCSECPKAFNKVQALREHQREQHPRGESRLPQAKYPCSRCNKAFKFPSLLTLHLTLVHHPPLRCAICCCRFQTVAGLRRHLADHPRSISSYNCGHCSERFMTFKPLKQHMGTDHHLEIIIDCQTCGRSFESNSCLQRHRRHHLEARPFHCRSCPSAFKHVQNLRVHQRLCHAASKPLSRRFQCEACKAKFASAASLLGHVALRRCNNDMTSCALCDAPFRLVAELHRHMSRVHSAAMQQQQRTYVCSHCDNVAYFDVPKLFRHIVDFHLSMPSVRKSRHRVKRGQQLKRYVSIAPAKLASTEPLSGSARCSTKAMRTNFEEAFRCQQCSASFKNYAYLLLHERWHTKHERSFQCTVCSAIYTNQGVLLRHLRIHGPRLFKCAQCPASFTHAVNLARHATSHSAARPYSCAVCAKTFKWKAARNEHQRQHHPTGQMQDDAARRTHSSQNSAFALFQHSADEYACHVCNAGFKRVAALDRHMALHSSRSSSRLQAATVRQHQAASSQKSSKRRLPAETEMPSKTAKLHGSHDDFMLRRARDRTAPKGNGSLPQKPLKDSRSGALTRAFSDEASGLRSRWRPQLRNNSASSPAILKSSSAPKLRSDDMPAQAKSYAPSSEARSNSAGAVSEASKLTARSKPASRCEPASADKQKRLRDYSSVSSSNSVARRSIRAKQNVASTNKPKALTSKR